MKFSSEKIEVFQSPSGSVETITLYEFDSEVAGPEVYLQASVHGAEVQGNLVLMFLSELCQKEKFKGKIRFIPMANPRGTNQKIGTATYGRFNPVTGHNWNRNYTDLSKIIHFQDFVAKNKDLSQQELTAKFKNLLKDTIEQEIKKVNLYGPNENKNLNLILQQKAATADIMLDLHTGPEACRYLYVPEYLKESSKNLQFPYSIIIPHEFAGAMDEACFVPWVRLTEECQKQGVAFQNPFEGYTVELSSEERVCSVMAREDLKRIAHYLTHKNVFENLFSQNHEQQLSAPLKNYKTYYAPSSGLCEFLVKPGETVSAGQKIATIYSWDKSDSMPKLIDMSTDILAQNPSAVINFTTSGIVYKGMELFQLLENPSTL